MADPMFVMGRVSRVADEKVWGDEDHVAVEEPLEIRLGRTPVAVTMRTPGHHRELAVGFLSTESIIADLSDLADTAGPSRKLPNVVSVQLRRGLRFSRSRLVRHFYTNSSCGLCGKTTLQAL